MKITITTDITKVSIRRPKAGTGRKTRYSDKRKKNRSSEKTALKKERFL